MGHNVLAIPAVALAESDGNLVSGQNLMVLGPPWPLIIQGFDAACGGRKGILECLIIPRIAICRLPRKNPFLIPND
jgi:hypothetical protein